VGTSTAKRWGKRPATQKQSLSLREGEKWTGRRKRGQPNKLKSGEDFKHIGQENKVNLNKGTALAKRTLKREVKELTSQPEIVKERSGQEGGQSR